RALRASRARRLVHRLLLALSIDAPAPRPPAGGGAAGRDPVPLPLHRLRVTPGRGLGAPGRPPLPLDGARNLRARAKPRAGPRPLAPRDPRQPGGAVQLEVSLAREDSVL